MVDSARIITTTKYTPIPKSNGRIEFQGVPYPFDSCSPIIEIPTVGEEFYNPNTDAIDFLVGKKKYKNITVRGILSKAQFLPLRAFSNTDKAKDGTLTATHMIGDIVTVLTGVRWLRLEYGDVDKSSSNAAMLKLEFSFSGIGSTNDSQKL